MRGRILCQHHLLAAQVGYGLDILAHDDAVTAVLRDRACLIDAKHDPAVEVGLPSSVDEALKEQRHHIQRGIVCRYARCRRHYASPIATGWSIKTRSTLNFSPPGVVHSFPALNSVVRKHNRCPTCPYVQEQIARCC